MYEISTYKKLIFFNLHNELDGQIPRPNTFTGNHLGDMKLKFASGASLSPLFTPAYIPTLHGEEGGGPWYLFQEGVAH